MRVACVCLAGTVFGFALGVTALLVWIAVSSPLPVQLLDCQLGVERCQGVVRHYILTGNTDEL